MGVFRNFIKIVDELFALLYQVLTTDIKLVHSSSISTSTSYKSVSQKSTATVYPSTVTRTTGTQYSVGTSSRTPPSLKPPSQTSRSSPSSSRWLHTLHYYHDQYQTSILKGTSHEIESNDHTKTKFINLLKSSQNLWRPVKRIRAWILGVKGLTFRRIVVEQKSYKGYSKGKEIR